MSRWSPETRAKMSAWQKGGTKPQTTGKNHGLWKGEAVSYRNLHRWLDRLQGKASEHLCGECLGPARHWANISGEYRRDVEDFIPMCVPHHMRLDRKRWLS